MFNTRSLGVPNINEIRLEIHNLLMLSWMALLWVPLFYPLTELAVS